MKLSTIIETSDTKIVTKIVSPGTWPRTGVAIPGSVLPWAIRDTSIWAQAKYTRDVMEEDIQLTHYLVSVPVHYIQNANEVVATPRGQYPAIEKGRREWVISVPCSFELVNVVNKPWDVEDEKPLPPHLGLIDVGWTNFVVDLGQDIQPQIETITGWLLDDISDLRITRHKGSYYSSQVGETIDFTIRPFI